MPTQKEVRPKLLPNGQPEVQLRAWAWPMNYFALNALRNTDERNFWTKIVVTSILFASLILDTRADHRSLLIPKQF